MKKHLFNRLLSLVLAAAVQTMCHFIYMHDSSLCIFGINKICSVTHIITIKNRRLFLRFIDSHVERLASASLLIGATQREASKLLIDVEASTECDCPTCVGSDKTVMVCLEIISELNTYW